jgi:hypothetical protein
VLAKTTNRPSLLSTGPIESPDPDFRSDVALRCETRLFGAACENSDSKLRAIAVAVEVPFMRMSGFFFSSISESAIERKLQISEVGGVVFILETR